MTKHDIYDEIEGFQVWNYMECDKDEEGRETWRINVEVKRGGEVVVPVVGGDRAYAGRGLLQLAGRVAGGQDDCWHALAVLTHQYSLFCSRHTLIVPMS